LEENVFSVTNVLLQSVEKCVWTILLLYEIILQLKMSVKRHYLVIIL